MTGDRAEEPFVSVVLPVRNEARDISRCLDAILGQDYPRDRMEILVVDGMSADTTRDVVAAYARRDPRVRLVENPGRIVPTGLNAAIRALRGEILVRVDGHTLIAPDYVRRGVEAIRRTGADVVGGAMEASGATPFGRAVAAATGTPMGVGGSAFHYATAEQDAESVYMGTFRRDVFTRFGTFDERCVRNQDDEFNYRVREGGGRVRLVPSMRSTYFPRETPRALFRQYYQYGYFKVLVAGLHPRMMRPRHFAPSAFVAVLAALAVAAALSAAGKLALAAVLAAHIAATLALTRPRCRGAARAWLLTPAATLLIHAAYGLGFLAGCLGALTGRAPGSSRGLLGRAP
ncbi:MAG: glycosyltransferase family 2 protein [Acidobacteria bacterium]|nr:glycosyltransferase family 2 protein [Acidobacteriota bacterium]